MSTATQAGTAAAPADKTGAETPAKPKAPPAGYLDIKKRILRGDAPPPPISDEEKQRLEKEAADKRAAEEKAEADKKAAEEKAAQEAKAKQERKKAPKLPEPPPIAPKPDTKTLAETVREILPEITRQNATPPPKLSPEVEAEIKLAEFAEKQGGEYYQGHAKKVMDFYVVNDEHLAAKAKELGGYRSEDYRQYLESEEYRGFVAQHRPTYQRGDKQKFQGGQIAARAAEQTRKELEPKMRELELKQLETQHAPEIDQLVHGALTVMVADPAEKEEERDPALVEFAKDPKKFGEQYPEEMRIIATEADAFTRRIRSIKRVSLGLEVGDVEKNADHRYVSDYMVRQNKAMQEKNPNGIRMPDGKILVDAETYHKHKLQSNRDYRTWTVEEVAGMLAAEGNAQILTRLKQRREGVAKSIYAKPPPALPPANNGQGAGTEETPPSPEASTSRASGSKKTPPKTEKATAKYR
jgi:hypothetical protein